MRTLIAAVAAILLVAIGTPAVAENPPNDTTSSSSRASAIPLVVILDVSDSMNERVGDVVKLQAAKRSLEPIIRAQAGTGNFGIWTYPAESDCGAGKYLVDVGNTQSVSDVLATVDLQTASGGTPTGPAIQAVADNLTSRGITEANLVLVSDGESNCSDIPPCDVAAQLASTGFDLTIQAVGFDISSAGRAELECIAAATGGHYFDVTDPDDLVTVVRDLGVPQVSLTVASYEAPRAGAATSITATIENPSAFYAVDVRVNLTFEDAGARTVFPAVIPPTFRVGNIPAGETVTRTWAIIAGQRGKVSDARFVVTAWSKGSPGAVVERSFTTSIEQFEASSLGPLFDGSTHDGRSLVIMGDSYSSGEGVGSYLPAITGVNEKCHRSSKTYLAPMMNAAGIPVDLIACSGAVTADFDDYATDRANAQIDQLSSLQNVPGAVVMTAGGNDIDFTGIIGNCVDPLKKPCTDDQKWVDSRYDAIEGMKSTLASTYKKVWSALNTGRYVDKRDGEFAPVIVLGYPQILHATQLGGCRDFTAAEVSFANTLVLTLNARIRNSVAMARSEGYEVYYVDSAQYAVLPDHTVCESGDDGWINPWLKTLASWPPARSESFHPKTSGYAATTDAIVEWSRTVEREQPSDVRKAGITRTDPFWSPLVVALTNQLRINGTADFFSETSSNVQNDGLVHVSAGGFDPGTPVTVQLRSDPITLGTVTAGEDGAVSADLLVPSLATNGIHRLVLMGVDADGNYDERSLEVSVVPSVPWWLPPLLVGSALAALGALVLAVLARRRYRAANQSSSMTQL